jgi:hypothetical protein
MRTNAAFIQHRVNLNLATPGAASDVLVSWNEWAPGAVDPVTSSKIGSPTPRTKRYRAFLHFIQPTNGAVRQFNEVETGDCIADFAPDADLDGKDDIRFTIDGRQWMRKPVSPRLAQAWDVVVGGVRMVRPVLLTKAT